MQISNRTHIQRFQSQVLLNQRNKIKKLELQNSQSQCSQHARQINLMQNEINND